MVFHESKSFAVMGRFCAEAMEKERQRRDKIREEKERVMTVYISVILFLLTQSVVAA